MTLIIFKLFCNYGYRTFMCLCDCLERMPQPRLGKQAFREHRGHHRVRRAHLLMHTVSEGPGGNTPRRTS